MRVLGLLLLLGGALFWWIRDVQARPIAHPPGITAPYQPYQNAANLPPPFSRKQYTFKPVARFVVEARVLGKRLYRYDRGSAISPLDLALGWGRMSDTRVIKKLGIRQSDRFYFYSWPDEPPIAPGEIVVSSANMHMVPGSEELTGRLRRVKAGNLVRLEGYLVNVTGPDGFYWHTSTTRADSGNGACELVWVEKLVVR